MGGKSLRGGGGGSGVRGTTDGARLEEFSCYPNYDFDSLRLKFPIVLENLGAKLTEKKGGSPNSEYPLVQTW